MPKLNLIKHGNKLLRQCTAYMENYYYQSVNIKSNEMISNSLLHVEFIFR